MIVDEKKLLSLVLLLVFVLGYSVNVYGPQGDDPDRPWPRPRIAPLPIEILCEDVEIAKI
ncbi:MAG: hypothetical protein FWE34_04950 [Defluviitaleaceae bacterium]|nr:hypothetical protein [Defluviitaleaceae bacterium]